MKIYLVFLVIIGLFYTNLAYSACHYQTKIDECVVANKNGTYSNISDYVCIVGSYEDIAFQVTLDMDFKVLDAEMDSYLFELETNKSKYFGKNREKTFIEGVNDIQDKRDYFYKEYKDICGITLIEKVQQCTLDNSVSITKSKSFFEESDCMYLVNKKLEIFNDVASSILMLNSQQIKTDEKKIYDQKERSNYDKLLDILRINIGYIERIWNKIPSFIEKPYK